MRPEDPKDADIKGLMHQHEPGNALDSPVQPEPTAEVEPGSPGRDEELRYLTQLYPILQDLSTDTLNIMLEQLKASQERCADLEAQKQSVSAKAPRADTVRSTEFEILVGDLPNDVRMVQSDLA